MFATTTRLQVFLTCLIKERDVSLDQGSFHNPRGTNIHLLPLEQGAKFTTLFLADDARELAAIPTVEMCQLLMGLSIETPFPQDAREIDIVVLTV